MRTVERDPAEPGVQRFDLWERNEPRLWVGGAFAGWGCLLGIGLRHFGEPDEPAPAPWIVCAVAALGVIPGTLFLMWQQWVELDPHRRLLTRTRFLLGLRVQHRSWSFNDLVAISLRHQATGDDTSAALVGIRPAGDNVIWLRSFPASADTPGEEATTLARKLAAMTGLPMKTEGL